MMKSRYKNWQAFKYKGKRFLALLANDGNTHIYDADFGNYGAWFSVKSFKEHFAKEGETLCLDTPQAETVILPQLKVVG